MLQLQVQQVLVNITDDWDAVSSKLHALELVDGVWMPALEPIESVVGKNGSGHGRGIVDLTFFGGPEKVEGDAKAPAGVFDLPTAFGFAPTSETTWIKLPYHPITAKTECVDDPASGKYNCLVERADNDAWASSEKMVEYPTLYKWGIVVNHNFPNPLVGKGSCVFVHIWREAGRGTGGCTAMAEADLVKVLTWLDPAKKPALVQMPADEYIRLAPELGLPTITR